MFENLFRKKKTEVFLTNSPELYSTVTMALKNADIPYEVKTKDNGSGQRQGYRGVAMYGRMGENTKVQTMYYIYVHPQDEERAQRVINEAKRRK